MNVAIIESIPCRGRSWQRSGRETHADGIVGHALPRSVACRASARQVVHRVAAMQYPPSKRPTAPVPPREVTGVPWWVIGLLLVGAALVVVRLPAFASSLADSVQKRRAAIAFDQRDFPLAVDGYRRLHACYPADKHLIQRLGFSYYRAGDYPAALRTFGLLNGKSLTRDQYDAIDAAIVEMKANRRQRSR